MSEVNKITGYAKLVISMLVLQAISTFAISVFVLRHPVPIHILQMVLPLIIAGCIGLGYRWSSIAAATYGGLLTLAIGGSLYNNYFNAEHLLYNPVIEASNPFTGANIGQLLVALGIVILSIRDIRIRYRGGAPTLGLLSQLAAGIAMGALSLGMVAALLAQTNWVAGISEQSIAVLPVFEMKTDGITPEVFESRKGEALVIRVVNHSDNSCHILEFPELDAMVHVEEGRSGLLFIRPEVPGTYTYQCKQHHNYVNEQIQGTLTVLP